MTKVINKLDSKPKKLKELMKAVKEAGGSLEEQIKAKETLKNYLKQAEENEKWVKWGKYLKNG